MIKCILSIGLLLLPLLLFKLAQTDHDNCYSEMEHEGKAAMGCCGGIFGGGKSTDYLSEICCDCPYLVLDGHYVNKKEEKEE